MKKTYVIADLHGRLDLLLTAIELIEKDAPDGGRLIVLGDFVDRGPDSKGVIERLYAGPDKPEWTWTVLQGNHEQIMLLGLMHPGESLQWWVRNGGGQTLKSYGYAEKDKLYPLKVPDEHMLWISCLPVWVEDDHRIYVHAGVPHDVPVADARPETLQWMIHGREDMTGATPGVLLDQPHMSGKHVVHGHVQDERNPLLKLHRTNLDSYAWKTGRLAIGVFDDTQGGGPAYMLYAHGEPFSY
jgi:serine/threonine protein phosphatase 1